MTLTPTSSASTLPSSPSTASSPSAESPSPSSGGAESTLSVVDAATGAQMTAVLDPAAGTLTNASTGEAIDPTTILVVDPESGDLIDPVSGQAVELEGEGTSTASRTAAPSTGTPAPETAETPTSPTNGGAPTVDTSYVDSVIAQVKQEHESGQSTVPADPAPDKVPGDVPATPETPPPGPSTPVDPGMVQIPRDEYEQLLRSLQNGCGTAEEPPPPPTTEPKVKPGTVPADCDMDDPVQQKSPTKGGKVDQKPEDCEVKHYTVRCGDSLSSIAKRFDTTWREIYQANKGKIDNPNMIYPGQRLRIPHCDDMGTAPPPKPPKPTTPADCHPDVPPPPPSGPPKSGPKNPPKPPTGPPTEPPPGPAPPSPPKGEVPPTEPPSPPSPPTGEEPPSPPSPPSPPTIDPAQGDTSQEPPVKGLLK